MKRISKVLGAVTAVLMLAACTTTSDGAENPYKFHHLGKIGEQQECDVLRIYTTDSERHYRVECPRGKGRFSKMGTFDRNKVPEHLKCRTTNVVGEQEAHDSRYNKVRWVSATYFKCWGPFIPGSL